MIKVIIFFLLVQNFVIYNKSNTKESFDYLNENSLKSNCFKNVVKELSEKCQEINELSKISFALKLSECFYLLSGKTIELCKHYENVLLCTKELKGDKWNTYLSFYNHADNLCFYYKEIIWKEESEKLMDSLFKETLKATNSIKENIESTNKIYEMHKKIDLEIRKNFEEVLKNNDEINKSYNEILSKHENISNSFEKMEEKIEKQEYLLNGIFNKLMDKIEDVIIILNWFSMQFFDFQSFCYYLFIFFLWFIITSFQTYYRIRGIVFIMIIINIIIEKLFLIFYFDKNFDFLQINKYQHYVYFIRFLFIVIILCKIFQSSINYIDYSEAIYHKLEDNSYLMYKSIKERKSYFDSIMKSKKKNGIELNITKQRNLKETLSIMSSNYEYSE